MTLRFEPLSDYSLRVEGVSQIRTGVGDVTYFCITLREKRCAVHIPSPEVAIISGVDESEECGCLAAFIDDLPSGYRLVCRSTCRYSVILAIIPDAEEPAWEDCPYIDHSKEGGQ